MTFEDIKHPPRVPDNPVRVVTWNLNLRNCALKGCVKVPVEVHWKPKGSDIEIIEYFVALPEWAHIEKLINVQAMKMEIRSELKCNRLI